VGRAGLEPATNGLKGRQKLVQFYCIINGLRRPRTFAKAVDCSATQGLAKRRCYVFVYSSVEMKMCALRRIGFWHRLRSDDGTNLTIV